MDATLSLIPIDRDGTPRGCTLKLDRSTVEVLLATAALYYDAAGFEEPWIGYLAVAGDEAVGICSFKSAPRDGCVEIAYFTFPRFERRGIATAMAAGLLAMAAERDPSVLVTAQTLPDRNASHRILEKLGFHHVSTVEHPEDGIVWAWHLHRGDSTER